MKIVFFGTPDYVLPILKQVHRKFATGPGISPIVAVVTQSPKPVGRRQRLEYSAVDKWAHEHKIQIYYSSIQLIKNHTTADLGILAAYGEIIPKEVIDLFPKGILVIHPSLLPAFRGASPIQAAITGGLDTTGVSIIKMDEKVDHGAIVVQFKEKVYQNDTTATLRERLFARSAEVSVETIPAYLRGKIKPKEQDHSRATYTKIITKQDGYVDIKKDDPAQIETRLRAYFPWPGIWTLVAGKRLKILKAHLKNNKLVFDEVQLEGKKPVSWKQFREAYPELDNFYPRT